jgi:CubicO group peptidase (beta-lactamase class C family)
MVLALLAASACASPPASPARPALAEGGPAPQSLDEFKTAVQAVLSETGVPGAGIALVRQSAVEWAGGVGLADRDRGTPVTADTHFRAGSISKTFIAMALVQLYETTDLDLDAPVSEVVAPGVDIVNPWEATDPVRVIHLLQHTAGFDDMHFNEMYNLSDPPDLPLEEVLKINPRSREVRWRPGTRVSYSNPGYAVAGAAIEFLTGEKYEDVIAEKIFKPVGMTSSSFVLTPADEAVLAKGYRDRTGPAVPYSQIYLRPSGNFHTSPADMGKFVQLLLNWGETTEELVVDPEFLSNMEHPRTSLASDAGLRSGYGSGIASVPGGPYPFLGHGGGIDGFTSQYAYSPARDVGYVVLLNSTHSPDAMRRIQSLAVQYLKADVEPPAKPQVLVPAATLRKYGGYYHDANPRNQAFAGVQWLLSGRSISIEGESLYAEPVFGRRARLYPVSETLFRTEDDVEATRVFATDEDGTMVFTGGFAYAERVPRWRVEIVRWPVFISFFLAATPLLMLIPWLVHSRRAEPSGFWWLKTALLLCAAAVVLPTAGIMNVRDIELGSRNLWTGAIFIGSLMLPVAALLSLFFTVHAGREYAGPWLRSYALVISVAALLLSAYAWSWGMIGFRSWSF